MLRFRDDVLHSCYDNEPLHPNRLSESKCEAREEINRFLNAKNNLS
jgi:hypothetical protein